LKVEGAGVGVPGGGVGVAEGAIPLHEDRLLHLDGAVVRRVSTAPRVVALAIEAAEVDVVLLGLKRLGNELLRPVALAAEVDLELDRGLPQRPRRLADRPDPLGVLGDPGHGDRRQQGEEHRRQPHDADRSHLVPSLRVEAGRGPGLSQPYSECRAMTNEFASTRLAEVRAASILALPGFTLVGGSQWPHRSARAPCRRSWRSFWPF